MKLSDIRGERTLEVIADLIEPIAVIAEDEEAIAFFKPQKPKKGQTPKQAFAERVRKGAPALLKGHKEEITVILATIKGVPRDEYLEQLTLAQLIGDMVELLTDEVFLGFLPSSETTEE